MQTTHYGWVEEKEVLSSHITEQLMMEVVMKLVLQTLLPPPLFLPTRSENAQLQPSRRVPCSLRPGNRLSRWALAKNNKSLRQRDLKFPPRFDSWRASRLHIRCILSGFQSTKTSHIIYKRCVLILIIRDAPLGSLFILQNIDNQYVIVNRLRRLAQAI